MVLTKAGHLFLEHANKIVADCNIAVDKMQELSSDGGEIDIGYVFPLAGHYIPHKVRRFLENKENSKVVFNFWQNHTPAIAEKVKSGEINIEDINEKLISDNIYTAGQPDPDLMIRTSRELRTSNFLPWQLTYSEFYFPDKHWPEFGREDLIEAIKVYQKRNRRFGGRPDEVKK